MANVISIRIEADGSAAVVETQKLSSDIKREMDKSASSVDLLSGAFNRLGPAALAAVGGFSAKAMIDQLHQAGMAAERLQNSFEAASGSIYQGAANQAYARAESQRLGLDLLSTSNAYLKLTASAKGTSLEGENTKAVFSSVAGAGRSLGLSAEEMSGALLAISQMMSKGTVQAEELRGQLGERLPGAFQIAARAMGTSTAHLGKMLEQGEVLSDEFLPKFAAELQKTFPPGEKAISGLTAETMRLKTAWYELKTSFMESGGEGMFTGAIRGMKTLAEYGERAVRTIVALDNSARPPAPLNRFEQDLAAPDFSVVGPSGGASGMLGSYDNIFAPTRPIPASTFSEKDKKAEEKASLAAARAADANAEAILHEHNAYIKLYNTLQDKRAEHNPLLAKEQQEALKLRLEYDNHIAQFPKLRVELERNFDLDFQQLSLTQQLTREMRERTAAIKELEEATKGLAEIALSPSTFGMAANNLQQNGLSVGSRYGKADNYSLLDQQPQKQKYSLINGGPGGADPTAATVAASDPRYFNSLTSSMSMNTMNAHGQQYDAQRTALLQQLDDRQALIQEYQDKELITKQEGLDLLFAADEEYAAQKEALDKATADKALQSLGNSLTSIGQTLMQGNKDQFEAGKAMAIAGAAIDTFRAATGAYAAMASIPYVGPVLGAAAAAAAVVSGMAQIAQIESTQYRGGRALGGPVESGSTYLVGERGPELLIMGSQGGTVTPNSALGGQSQPIRVTNVYQISTGVADTVRAEIMKAVPAITQHSVAAVGRAINSGGPLSAAVGRM